MGSVHFVATRLDDGDGFGAGGGGCPCQRCDEMFGGCRINKCSRRQVRRICTARVVREQVCYDVMSYINIQQIHWCKPSGWSPTFVGFTVTFCVQLGGSGVVSLFLMSTGGAGVTPFNFEAMGQTISGGIPVGDYWRPMGRAIVGSAGRGSSRWRKAKTGNGSVGIGECFCKLFVCGDEFFHHVILLEGGVCKVVE
jgi:hypothetical protein